MGPITGEDVRESGRWPAWVGRRAPWWLAALFTALAGIVLLAFAETEHERWRVAERNRILSQTDTIRSRLESLLSAPLLRTRGMAAHIIAKGDISQREFDVIAEFLLRGYSHVRNIVVSRGLVIAMSYPLAGNEKVIGVNYSDIPAQYVMVRKAIDTHAPVLQGPIPLIQGGIGLISRLPVFLQRPDGSDGEFFGMVNIILDVPSILRDAGLDDPDLPMDVALRVGDNVGAAYRAVHGDQSLFDQDPVLMDVTLPLGSWQMAATPKGGWREAERKLSTTRAMIAAIFLLTALSAFGVARHITDRARRERALRARGLELQRSNADLERFAYVASHDLQTPLRNVASYVQLLERRYRGRLDSDADEFIAFAVDGCQRMSQMIVDLLNYARVTSAGDPLIAIPAATALEQALANLKGEIEASGARVDVGPLPEVMAAPAQLASVFQNLVSNAIKYRHPDRQPWIDIQAVRDGDGLWRFKVADNGIGIEPQYYEQIFNFFERLHPQGTYEGAGVGLAVCRRIIHRFGGEIWVDSKPEQGSVFLFTLPDAQRRA